MSKTKIIPIFPLDLVLFPNQELPLRIFEPRYKQMIDDCMLSNKEFGVCLTDSQKTISDWEGPHIIGTIAKIIDCNDIDPTSGHLILNTKGHQKFRIVRMITPSINKPSDYDPYSYSGKEKIEKLDHDSNSLGKMYIQAEVELLDDIDNTITLKDWQTLIESWKRKISNMTSSQTVSSEQLDLMLEQYYLKTETPTLEYVYSLCALGASSPDELQPILESNTLEELLDRCLRFFNSDSKIRDF